MSGYYIYIGGRNCGRFSTIPDLLEYWFGGTCEYTYDQQQQIHHYLIKNDDIGFIDMTVTNECFMYESFDVRMTRMCEEYLAHMEYKYRDYMCREKILNSIDKYVVEKE